MTRIEVSRFALKQWIPFALVLFVAFCSFSFITSHSQSVVASTQEARLLRHVVQFQFKKESTEADIQKVVDAFRALPQKISAIADFEYGTDNSPEKLADGFTHCFLVTFRSEADRDVYLPHPAHDEFVSVLKPHLEKVQVIDYWASK